MNERRLLYWVALGRPSLCLLRMQAATAAMR